MKKLCLSLLAVLMLAGCSTTTAPTPTPSAAPETTPAPTDKPAADGFTGPTQDSVTSASIVPENLVKTVEATGFTDSDKEKALVIIGDPRHNSVLWDMANTTIAYLQEKGMEVEKRDLYTLNFDPVLSAADF